MEMQCELLLYLDRKGFLDRMKEYSVLFLRELSDKPNQTFLPFKYFLSLDVMHLIDFSPDVGQLLIEEPLIWQNMASDILFSCVQSIIHDVDYRILPEQVRVQLRLYCVPTPLVQPNKCFHSGLVSFKGLLVNLTKPVSYVYHSVWSCREYCDDNEVILHGTPKIPPKCAVCRGVLYEHSGQRRCGDKVLATFLLGKKSKPKFFTIVDDLIPWLQLGFSFQLVGYTVKKNTTILCVESVQPPALVRAPTPRYPSEIHKLLRKCNAMPWKFIYCLASGIGVDVCPLSCFMHLKMSLLLSLATVTAAARTNSTCNILHVLVSGCDSGHAGALLQDAARLGGRRAALGPAGAVAAALVASSGGVCALPLPLHAYSQKQTSQLLSAIENKEVVTDSGAAPLRSAVWAHGMDFKKINLANVASVFGFVARADCGEHGNEIVEFLLQDAVDPPDAAEEQAKATRDVRNYLDAVAGIDVTLSGDAEELLRSYFLCARRERGGGGGGGAALAGLAAAAAGAARLCGRGRAGAADAVLAAWLHAAGAPGPRLAPEEYLRAGGDARAAHAVVGCFKDWLAEFTGRVINA